MRTSPEWAAHITLKQNLYTERPDRISHRKWRETKQQQSRARSGNEISCCLVFLYFLCEIPSSHVLARACNTALIPFRNEPSSPVLLASRVHKTSVCQTQEGGQGGRRAKSTRSLIEFSPRWSEGAREGGREGGGHAIRKQQGRARGTLGLHD